MKEIWINLELYFESYGFYNFRDFFRIFSDFIFDLKRLKEIKKWQKVFYFRTGPTWMRRGTQGHVAAPRGPTRCLRGVFNNYIIFTYSI